LRQAAIIVWWTPCFVASCDRVSSPFSVAVRELVSLAFATLLAEEGAPAARFDTGGEALELGEVAKAVAAVLGGEVLRRPLTEPGENRYAGNDAGWRALLTRHAIEPLPLDRQIVETATYLARMAKAAVEG
jgi:hypothetical protein